MAGHPYNQIPARYVVGVPDFLELDSSKASYPILNLVSLARTIGWRKAVLGDSNVVAKKYATHRNGALFLELVRIAPKCRVADLCAGHGLLSAQLSRKCPDLDVYAFDEKIEELLFLDVIKEQEHLSNLHIARVDRNKIPVEDNCFDLVLLLEMPNRSVVSSGKNASIEDQTKLLFEIKRFLKKGGSALIGLENKYGYHRLMRRREDSVGFSYRSYRKLVESIGFSKVEAFVACPSSIFPKAISDSRNVREMMNACSRAEDWRWMRLLPDTILRWLVPAFYFVVEK